MRKIFYQRTLIGLLVIGISLACGIPFIQGLQPETATPTATASPMESKTPIPSATLTETATLIPTATEVVFVVPPATPTPKFAPFCEPSSASVATPVQCQVPIAEQSSVFCSSKIPYNLILINAGSTYETSSEDFSCKDGGMKGDKQILTCTGPMALTYEIKVCDPSCAHPSFQPVTTRCPQDFYFNSDLGCCQQQPVPIDQNCVVLKLKTTSCVTNCGVYTSQSNCEANGFACYWDGEDNVCRQRK